MTIGEMMTTMTSGKTSNGMACDSFKKLFDSQRRNQSFLLSSGKYNDFTDKRNFEPTDDPKLCSYHIQQLMSEIGEVLDADKRWKNFRNDKCDVNGKYEEIADCFIVMMNIAMFSGMDAESLYNAISSKIDTVSERIKNC